MIDEASLQGVTRKMTTLTVIPRAYSIARVVVSGLCSGKHEVRAMKLSATQKQRLEEAFRHFEANHNSQTFLAAVEKVTGVTAHSKESYQILRFAESSCTNPYDPENKPIRSDPNLLAACARSFVALVETV
jgi:hypothetical protein